jgi:hypothetical protein
VVLRRLREVRRDLLAVRRVADDEPPGRLDAVHDEVVEDRPRLVARARVERLPVRQPRRAVRDQVIDDLAGELAREEDLAHVRDVEEPGRPADRPVLLAHALVLHGHLPAGERHEAPAEPHVLVVEGRSLQGRGGQRRG